MRAVSQSRDSPGEWKKSWKEVRMRSEVRGRKMSRNFDNSLQNVVVQNLKRIIIIIK